MKKRMEALQGMLTKLGMSQERLRISYVSAAEGLIFANTMKEMSRQMDDLGLEKIQSENTKLRPIMERMLARKGLLQKT
jgi:coenzyme F420-reducing hydrogenase delta subunit